jgi:hypothetical protein
LGFHSPENLLGALDDELTMIPGITAEVAEQIRNVARTVQAGVAEKKVTTAAPVRQATVTIEEKEERADPELRRFNLVKELSPQAIQALIEAGYSTVDKVAEEKNLAHLSAIPGFSLKRSRATKTACAMYLKMETEAGGFWKLVGEEPPAPPAPPVVLVPDPVDDLTEDETSEPDVESAASDDVDSANDTEASSSEAEPDTLDVVEDDTGSQDADEEPLLAAVDEAVESNGDDEATPNAAGAEVS